MAPVNSSQVSSAVGHFVLTGEQPSDTNLVSAELSPDVLDAIQEELLKAEKTVQDEVTQIKSVSDPGLDSWIAQADRLHQEIQASRALAREIIQEAEEHSKLVETSNEASSKSTFIQKEIEINRGIVSALEGMQNAQELLKKAGKQALGNHWTAAISTISDAEAIVQKLPHCEGTFAQEQLLERVRSARTSLGAKVNSKFWQHLVRVEVKEQSMTILTELDEEDERRDRRGKSLNIEETVEVMHKLGTLRSAIGDLVSRLNQAFIYRLLDRQVTGKQKPKLSETGAGDLRLEFVRGGHTANGMLASLTEFLDYCGMRLPRPASRALMEALAPQLFQRTIDDWTSPDLPTTLNQVEEFQTILQNASSLVSKVKYLWPEAPDDLQEWIEEVHVKWRNRTRELCLQKTRALLIAGFGETTKAERVETESLQQVEAKEELESQDEWSENWSDDEKQVTAETTPDEDDEDDDDAAWGITDDDIKSPKSAKSANQPSKPNGDGAAESSDAWGWGDEEDEETPKTPKSVKTPKTPKRTSALGRKVNGHHTQKAADSESTTLQEQYTITSLPGSISTLIKSVITDADQLLAVPGDSDNPLRPAAGGLYNFPTQILALYRAIGIVSYTTDENGSMYLFNDCLAIADILNKYAQDRKATTSLPPPIISKLNLSADLALLTGFGQRCYTQSLDMQKQILSDMIEGAQGFQHVTESPFAEACSTAVNSGVSRVRECHDVWKPILSRTHLLSATGSLLRVIVDRMILDILDMSDISEPESKKLVQFCQEISQLEEFFMPPSQPNANGGDFAQLPLTAVFCQSWLRFQYLANILDGSLADIQYMWFEGGLRQDFEADEVVDLIEALFADSNLRKRAVAEIRDGNGSP